MPKVNSLESWVFPPKSNVAKPLRKTPYDQSQARPATDGHMGQLGAKVDHNSPGGMNMGGKRRPGHNARYGID